MQLPEPDQDSLEHSKAVQHYIEEKITERGEPIPFVEFMEHALYAPGLGYYVVGTQKFGRGGDFVTAPEISPLFSHCIANYCAKELAKYPGEILEFGAGTGIMAADILSALEKKQQLPERYLILEVSADLRERQQHTLKERVPHLFEKVDWLNQLPERPIQGVMIANEVLDAMPVVKFKLSAGQVEEFCVDQKFTWVTQSASESLRDDVLNLPIDVEYDYESEINVNIPGWIKSVSEKLSRGKMLVIDYGFLRNEYYHPERNMGTLKCHFRHHSHDDPLIYPGIQDITAHVDFTAVGEAGVANGMSVELFQNQAKFLLENGLLELAQTAHTMELSQQIKTLTLPHEMGEIFKVMALAKPA